MKKMALVIFCIVCGFTSVSFASDPESYGRSFNGNAIEYYPACKIILYNHYMLQDIYNGDRTPEGIPYGVLAVQAEDTYWCNNQVAYLAAYSNCCVILKKYNPPWIVAIKEIFESRLRLHPDLSLKLDSSERSFLNAQVNELRSKVNEFTSLLTGQLAEFWKQLEEVQRQLNDSQRQLEAAKRQVEEKQTQLDDAKRQLADAQKQLEEVKKQSSPQSGS
jgi:hypothetical protein